MDFVLFWRIAQTSALILDSRRDVTAGRSDDLPNSSQLISLNTEHAAKIPSRFHPVASVKKSASRLETVG